jgi:hypothetical protein|tara:strand:+ start:704 stop:928 length:225 start_codon:yes stop_codon:yes gene_type:complete
MSAQKSSRVDLLEKKVAALIGVIKQLMDESSNLRDLSVGTLETVKLMSGYDEAIEELKENIKNGEKEQEKKLEL